MLDRVNGVLYRYQNIVYLRLADDGGLGPGLSLDDGALLRPESDGGRLPDLGVLLVQQGLRLGVRLALLLAETVPRLLLVG